MARRPYNGYCAVQHYNLQPGIRPGFMDTKRGGSGEKYRVLPMGNVGEPPDP